MSTFGKKNDKNMSIILLYHGFEMEAYVSNI